MLSRPSADFKRERTFVHCPPDLGYEDLIAETTGSGSRAYTTPTGEKLPSITTVLSILSEQHIYEWRKRVGAEEANRVSRAATTRGTALHALVERYVKNEEVVLTGSEMPNVLQMFRAILPTINTRIGKVFLQEAPLYSLHLGVAGRTDLIAEFDGVPSIIDVKTSSRVKKRDDVQSYFMQEAAYAIMYEERTGMPISRLVTLMAVEGSSEPLVFLEKRDDWTDQLHRTIHEYKTRRLFGHRSR